MKRILAFSLVASLASDWLCASCALSADQQADTGVQDTLVQIEHQWTDAAVKGDVAAFSRFIADEWILTYSDGSLVTKPMALADLKEGALRIESYHLDDISVRAVSCSGVRGDCESL